MFRIRPAQIKALQSQMDEALVKRIVEHLQANHSTYVDRLPDDALGEMVRSGLVRARNHGLEGEVALTAFVVLMFVIAPNFDELPATRQVLEDESVPPDARMDQLAERVADSDWEEAARRYSADAWFPDSEGVGS